MSSRVTLGSDEGSTASPSTSTVEAKGDAAAALGPSLSPSSESLMTISKKAVSGIESCVYGSSLILNDRHVDQLEGALPQVYQANDWRLLFRMSRDGANMTSLLHRCREKKQSLLIVKDNKGAIFGALVTSPLKAANDKYFGSGTNCVFSFKSGTLEWFPSSHKNTYFLNISPTKALGIGGGGAFALKVDEDLNNGSSGPCETFSSPCLASGEEFTVSELEVYAFSIGRA